jgi:hypothetical protein
LEEVRDDPIGRQDNSPRGFSLLPPEHNDMARMARACFIMVTMQIVRAVCRDDRQFLNSERPICCLAIT